MTSTKQVNIWVPVDADLRDELQDAAKLDERSMASFARVAIRERVDRIKFERQSKSEQPTAAQAGAV